MPVFKMVLKPYMGWVPESLPWEKTALTSVKRESIVSTLVLKFGSSELPEAFPKNTTRCNLGCYEFNVMLENLDLVNIMGVKGIFWNSKILVSFFSCEGSRNLNVITKVQHLSKVRAAQTIQRVIQSLSQILVIIKLDMLPGSTMLINSVTAGALQSVLEGNTIRILPAAGMFNRGNYFRKKASLTFTSSMMTEILKPMVEFNRVRIPGLERKPESNRVTCKSFNQMAVNMKRVPNAKPANLFSLLLSNATFGEFTPRSKSKQIDFHSKAKATVTMKAETNHKPIAELLPLERTWTRFTSACANIPAELKSKAIKTLQRQASTSKPASSCNKVLANTAIPKSKPHQNDSSKPASKKQSIKKEMEKDVEKLPEGKLDNKDKIEFSPLIKKQPNKAQLAVGPQLYQSIAADSKKPDTPTVYTWPTGSGDMPPVSLSKSDLSKNVSKVLAFGQTIHNVDDAAKQSGRCLPDSGSSPEGSSNSMDQNSSQFKKPVNNLKQKDPFFSTIESRVSFFEKLMGSRRSVCRKSPSKNQSVKEELNHLSCVQTENSADSQKETLPNLTERDESVTQPAANEKTPNNTNSNDSEILETPDSCLVGNHKEVGAASYTDRL